MQAQAARLTKTGRTPITAAMLAALVCAGGVAKADSLPDARKPILRPGKSTSETLKVNPASRCANYGEGFVPVVGSDGCVKIGGRLRIDLGGSGRAPVYAEPHDGISPAAHLRISR